MTSNLKYIGGEYASHELLPFIKKENQTDFLKKKVNGKRIYYYETGVDALASIIIHRCENKKALQIFVPDNYCFETLERLQIKLRKQNIEITSIIKYQYLNEITIKNFSCVILSHYSVYKQFDKYNFGENGFTIEDFVHAPFEIQKFQADYAINSLRKFCNLEVSIAYVDENIQSSKNSVSHYYEYKKEAEKLKTQFFETGNEDFETAYLSLYQKANESLLNDEVHNANTSEVSVLEKTDFNAVLKIRKNNFLYLKKQLSAISQVKILDGDYMYLMIDCEFRDELKRYLAQQGIFTAIHWIDSKSEHIKKRLTLHIDHRYNVEDLNKVYDAIKSFYAK